MAPTLRANRLKVGDFLPDGGQVISVGAAIGVRYTDVYGAPYHQLLPYSEVERRMEAPRRVNAEPLHERRADWIKRINDHRMKEIFGDDAGSE